MNNSGVSCIVVVREHHAVKTPVKNNYKYCYREFSVYQFLTLLLKLNLWLAAFKGATPVNYISATDWQIALRRDNVISITLRQVY